VTSVAAAWSTTRTTLRNGHFDTGVAMRVSRFLHCFDNANPLYDLAKDNVLAVEMAQLRTTQLYKKLRSVRT
jgi:hypothetical protein